MNTAASSSEASVGAIPLASIDSAKEFASFVSAAASVPRILLCLQHKQQSIEAWEMELMQLLRRTFDNAAPRITVGVWRCGGVAFSDARLSMSISASTDAAVFVVVHQQFADRLDGSAAIREKIDVVAESVAKYSTGGVTSMVPSSSSAVQVNVTKMLLMGQNLMGKGQVDYAEKFFTKALGVLEALMDSPETSAALDKSEQRDNLAGSLAMTLGWTAIARLVQGNVSAAQPLIQRLETGDTFAQYRDVPQTEAARAIATYHIMRLSPAVWTGSTCSQKVLREKLQADPTDATSRAMLCVTLFLSGDVERCLTEALKLHLLKGAHSDFGQVVLDHVVKFLGTQHEVVQRLGYKPVS